NHEGCTRQEAKKGFLHGYLPTLLNDASYVSWRIKPNRPTLVPLGWPRAQKVITSSADCAPQKRTADGAPQGAAFPRCTSAGCPLNTAPKGLSCPTNDRRFGGPMASALLTATFRGRAHHAHAKPAASGRTRGGSCLDVLNEPSRSSRPLRPGHLGGGRGDGGRAGQRQEGRRHHHHHGGQRRQRPVQLPGFEARRRQICPLD